MAEQLREILNRLEVLENAGVYEPALDYKDPVLIYQNADGTPADPSVIEKIPDLVKDIPVFYGDNDELTSWIKDVDALVRAYTPTLTSTVAQKNKFYAICTTIRRKIRGEASNALVNSNVNTNWNAIKRTLTTYYGEKRDLTTLDNLLSNTVQRGRTLEVFYDEVNKLLSLIAGQIKNDPAYSHPEASSAMINMYNKKAIDAFVKGLDGEVGKFLNNKEPDSLAAAYAYCVSFQNIEFRKSVTRPKTYDGPKSFVPPIPPRMIPKQDYSPQNFIRKSFQQPIRPAAQIYTPQLRQPVFARNPIQQFAHQNNFQRQSFGVQQQNPFKPLYQRNPFQQQNIKPQQQQSFGQPQHSFQQQQFKSQQQKPNFEKPTPMEVDQSIQSRQVNYVNRPNVNLRPHFNIETNQVSHDFDNVDTEQYLEQVPYLANEGSDGGVSFDRYLSNISYEEAEDSNGGGEVSELNFLV